MWVIHVWHSRWTSDLDVTGSRPPAPQDIYVMGCWFDIPNKLNLLSWLLTYLCNE